MNTAARVMPAQKPYRSVQIVGTPSDLLDAVEVRFGDITFDLAATAKNSVADKYFGPDSARGEDALVQNWSDLRGNLWLNPPYGDIKIWAAKCARTACVADIKIFLLIPASVGSIWWANYVDKKAAVFFLSPRITFVNHATPYPKDVCLCIYGAPVGYECWRWKK